MKIKFCGIRRVEDVMLMNIYMPDYAGFVFSQSRRQINLSSAITLSNMLHKKIKKVGVFVNEKIEHIAQISHISRLDVIQLHGDEDEEYIRNLKKLLIDKEIWKAVRVSSPFDVEKPSKLPVDMLLLDSFSENQYGGTGKLADLSSIKKADLKRDFFIAGGLNSQNINSIIDEIKPVGVDISSGIEIDGCKDENKIKEIMRCLK